jgi:hypothetical protein
MASCSICALPALTMVNRALVAAEPIAELARRHNVSRQALMRHKAEHLPPAQVEAQSVAAGDHGATLVAELRVLQGTLTGLLVMAQAKGDFRGATGVVRECARVLEMIARMEGALQPPPMVTINLVDAPEFQAVSHRILLALDCFPDAKLRWLKHCGNPLAPFFILIFALAVLVTIVSLWQIWRMETAPF